MPPDCESARRLVDAYLSAWNLEHRADRDAVLARIWAPEGRYVDPRADVRGRAALADLIEHASKAEAGSGNSREVVIAVLTDGKENASRRHTRESVLKLVEQHG